MGELLAQSAQRVAFFAILGTAGLIATARPLVGLVFLRGHFGTADAQAVSTLLVFFALGLTAWSLQAVVVRGFYAKKDTLTPMLIGTVLVLIAIPVYQRLYARWDAVGLAVASSLGITANALSTLALYKYRGGSLPLAPIGAGAMRGFLMAVPCGLAAWGVVAEVGWRPAGPALIQQAFALALPVLAFGVVGVAQAAWLQPPELMDFVNKVRGRARRALGRKSA